jgi:MtrB/PioB family decaheme-associated outer membrane protein
MKTRLAFGSFSPLSLAVRCALTGPLLLPLAALAEEQEIATLVRPVNFVEIGATNATAGSAKFGEYNGLNQVGTSLIANFSFRGGDAYGSFDGGSGTGRWELTGIDLGTTSRELSAAISNQGKWDLGISYNELRHQGTDSYQTPFQGFMGGNSFVLPPSFGVIDAAHRGPEDTGTQALTAAQLGSFHTENVYTSRKNASFNAGYQFNRHWSVRFDFNRLDQSGAKLIGAAFDGSGGGAGENSATLMNPTNYQTDTYKLALNWVGDKGHFSGSYVATFFKDAYDSVTWSNPFVDDGLGNGLAPAGGVFPVNIFATAPNNDFYQLKLSGDYDLTPATQFTGGFSYGRNTQNVNFINDPLLTSALPASSLNGLVVTTHADLKLAHHATRDLVLSAGLKYNQRDNQTPSHTYDGFNSVAGDPFLAAVNTPVSNQTTQLELAGNYRLDKKQSAYIALEFEKTRHWCNNELANSAQSPDVLANFPTYYTASACVQSPEMVERKLSANYRLKASDDVNLTAGYVFSKRLTTINSAYYNPMQTSTEGLQNLGYVPYFNASRTEQLVKVGVNWQANEQLNLGLNGRYVKDDYDATLGVQQGYAWGMNLDASYSFSRNIAVSGYMSAQHRQRDLLAGFEHSPQTAPTNLWTNKLTDDDRTIGFTARQTGLMAGKLTLVGDLSYSLSTTGYSTQVQTADPLCDTYGITCGNLPDIRNEALRFKINAAYQIDKSSKIAVGYLFKQLKSSDYYYGAYQTGSTDVTVLPSNQQEPNYVVNLVSVSYTHRF